MLCPKCGFISFDNLLVCGKCTNDLTAVCHALRGTAACVESALFLGSVLKSTTAAAALAGSEERVHAAAGFEQPVEAEAEEVTLLVDNEAPALEFDESEMPPLEEPGVEEGGAAVVEEEIQISMPAMGLAAEELSLAAAPEVEPVEETPTAGAPEPETFTAEEEAVVLTVPDEEKAVDDIAAVLEIDESSLSLEPAEEAMTPPVVEEPKAAEDTAGQLTLDLDEIDLSDLTSTPAAKAGPGTPGAVESAASDAEGIAFDDTMDLSLIIGDVSDSEGGESLDLGGTDSDVAPVDLTLVDDALVELTVEPSREDRAAPSAEAQSEELELAMEPPESR